MKYRELVSYARMNKDAGLIIDFEVFPGQGISILTDQGWCPMIPCEEYEREEISRNQSFDLGGE